MNNRTIIMIAMVAVVMMMGTASAGTSTGTVGGVTATVADNTSVAGNTGVWTNFTINDTTNTTSWYNITFPSGFDVSGAVVTTRITSTEDPSDWSNNTGTLYINVSSDDPTNVSANVSTIQYINISNVTVPSTAAAYVINVTTNNTITVPLEFTVTVEALGPDLTVESITPNCGYLFGNESNNISAVIKNIGDADAGASNVSFALSDGHSEIVLVPALAAGANETVTITDPTSRYAGAAVTINVTADCNGEVIESNETNNVTTLDVIVVNNGYKGKTYTGGLNITTVKSYDLNGNLVYSAGDSYYLSSSSDPHWTAYNASWTASDLPVTGTVREARLYVTYTWDKKDVMQDNVSLKFNDIDQTQDAHYWDEKMFATSYPYGMLVYNVTDNFNTGGNYANLTNSYTGGDNVSMRGMLLIVVYENASEPRRLIYINEEFDLIYGGSGQCTTPEEATAWAPITGSIDTGLVANATLITVAPGAGPTEGELIFNGQVWTDVWNCTGSSQIGIDERDVKSDLKSTDNLVGFRSSADYMEASNAFLVVEYSEVPVLTVTATPSTINVSEATDITINVTDESTGAPIVGADVTLEFGGSEIANCTTTGGECTVAVNVTETGTINVTATKDEYATAETTVTVVELANIVINEFVANPSSCNDWVELYNPTGSDVSLDGWALNDSTSQIKSLSGTINASGYRVFEVSNRLGMDDDTITLLNGTTVVDEVTYGDAAGNAPVPTTNESAGRYPNGIDTNNDRADFRVFDIPTRNATNTIIPRNVTTITVTPSPVSLIVDVTQQFTPTAYDQVGNKMIGVDFAWGSSNTTVGTVNDTGFFTANATGTTMVNATTAP
jgi:hypothetical protein